MVKFFQVVIDGFTSVSWSEWCQLIGAGATVVLVFFAWKGLTTWKRQAHTQMKIKFIDELIDSQYEYIHAMSIPVQIVGFVEIGIEPYFKLAHPTGNHGENDGFIQYIKSRGKEDAEKIFKHLENARPFKSKLQSLFHKGQVLGFENYAECFQAGLLLNWSYDKIGALAALISNPHYNWENEQVKTTLSKYRDIKKSEFEKNLQENNVKILEFAKYAYMKLLTKDD
jgi:hypothetical protein